MLIKRGAEASLYLETFHNRKVIKKKRHKKNYRLPELDKEIQNQRTRRESQMIHKAKEAGVPTPVIYLVDLDEATIIMEYIEGKTIKYFFDNMAIRNILRLCEYMGRLIGKLHNYGIIHGDLTTSNMILTTRDHRIVFVDFGLSEQTISIISGLIEHSRFTGSKETLIMSLASLS